MNPFEPLRLVNTPELVCPYCYSAFAERDILFRCTGLPGPEGRTCPVGKDTALETHLGRNEHLPPVFAHDGRLAHAVCQECMSVSGRHVCPTCHAQLPVGFGRIRSRTIALVGAREVGKTVFMTVLVHELMNRVGARFDASVGGADDHTRHRFSAEHEARLYNDARTLRGTQRTRVVREPLVFRFTTQRRNLFGLRRPQHTLLSFLDTAGEDLHSAESVATNLRYLHSADGVILLLDPLQMADGPRLADPGARIPLSQGPEHQPLHMLERVTELLLNSQGSAQRLLRVPIAVCLTKIDAMRGQLDQGAPLRRPEADTPYFDIADSQDVHAQVRQLLHRWDGDGIDSHIRNHYRNARYFGVSSLGDSPDADNFIRGGVRPYRVADPFLWMLGEFGVIPCRS